jgi:uncharacterized protein
VSSELRRSATALVSGLLFGAGLVVSGMTRPQKVTAFLDVFGDWDPSLAFVMGGALGVAALAFRWVRGRSRPLAAPAFSLPAPQSLDAGLIGGAAVFGVGWGISGYCPGPSVVALASGGAGVVVFVVAVLAGIALVGRVERRASARDSASPTFEGGRLTP